VIATDVSAAALEVAQRNVNRYNVEMRVGLALGDLLPDRAAPGAAFDLIVSNPPYVPDGDRPGLPAEVREYEPAAALFGGADGLDVIRRLVPLSAGHLKSGGHLIFEIGMGQDRTVSQLISETPGLKMLDLREDLQRIPRTMVVQRI
jgi:release factor glutamine methyltransferase